MSHQYATDAQGSPIHDPRVAIAYACRILGAEGQSDLDLGHVSIRDADGRGTWIKGRGKGFEEITPGDVILIDDDGQVIEGDVRCHAEFPIHTEILRARSDLGAVVHTHARAVVAISAIAAPMRAISHEGTLFVDPPVARFDETADLITTRELGASIAQAMGEQNALILVNHGMAAAGTDIELAIMHALMLDRACQIQLMAASAGEIVNYSDDAEARAKRSKIFNEPNVRVRWQYLLRLHGIGR